MPEFWNSSEFVPFDEEAAVLFVQFITALVHMGVPINDIAMDEM